VPLFGASVHDSRVQNNRTFIKNFLVEAGLPILPSISADITTEADHIRSFICENSAYPRFDIIPEDTSPCDIDLLAKSPRISSLDGMLSVRSFFLRR
jgi:hypothetical protein